MLSLGIDVSKHQGKIDWHKVKLSGVTFAILRAGYGRSTTQKDPTFDQNYEGCKANGINVGAYMPKQKLRRFRKLRFVFLPSKESVLSTLSISTLKNPESLPWERKYALG